MKRFSGLIQHIILALSFTISSISGQEADIGQLCPRAVEIGAWQPDGDAEYARGDDLYLLINGGAEIYQEYGFVETVFQSYQLNKNRSINLEIYQMRDSAAAYGMYTFKTGSDGEPIDIGHDGWFSGYYINFWKGYYLVTVIGLATDSLTLAGVVQIARIVESKIRIEAEKPLMVGYLPKKNLLRNGITYIRGTLALYNEYVFETKDVFAVGEAVVGQYANHRLFLCQYNHAQDASERFNNAAEIFKSSSRYKNYKRFEQQFICEDKNGTSLTVQSTNKWILIALGESISANRDHLEILQKRLIP